MGDDDGGGHDGGRGEREVDFVLVHKDKQRISTSLTPFCRSCSRRKRIIML